MADHQREIYDAILKGLNNAGITDLTVAAMVQTALYKAGKYGQVESERDSLQSQLDAARAQSERLREAGNTVDRLCPPNLALNAARAEWRKAVAETPEQSLAEVEARAIEREVVEKVLAIEPGINKDRACVTLKELRQIAARLHQQAKEAE